MTRPVELSDEQVRNADGIILVDRQDNELTPMPLRLSPPRGRGPGADGGMIHAAIRVLITSDEERQAFETRVREVCGPTIAEVFPELPRIIEHYLKDANDHAVVFSLRNFIEGYVAYSGFKGTATFAPVTNPTALVDYTVLDWMKLVDVNGDVAVVASFNAGNSVTTTISLHRVDPKTQTYLIKAFGIEQSVNVQSRSEMISFYQQIRTRWERF